MANYSPNTLATLQRMTNMIMHAAEGETLEQVLQQIADASRVLVGTKYAALGVPDGSGGLRHFQVSGVTPEEIARIEHPPVGRGMLGVIMNERVTVMLDNIRDDPRSVGFPHGHPSMTSMLGVPIHAGDELFGMLYLTDKVNGEPFNDYDRWLVETMARYAALAIAGTHLRDNQRRITLLEERQRIGMELHDGVIQSLYAMGMHLDLIRSGVMSVDSLDQSVDELNRVIDDIRAYIQNLKAREGFNQQDAMTSVRSRMESIVANLYVSPGITVTINAPDVPPRLPTPAFESLSMIAREALSNALRHATASYITIRCEQDDGVFRLLVRDDGRGFDPATLDLDDGLGLQNIKARTEQLGGDLTIESEPGHGTGVLVTVPLIP